MAEGDGRVGGRYRLDRHLASGGMGTVWQGWDEVLQRAVAIKKMHLQPGLSAGERDVAVQRAMREARLTARLHHPHAVQVFDVVDDPDGPCLIMQYVPSRSLDDIVRDTGPLAPPEVARIGTQVAAALAAAHRVGIVHRDVKPGNILIGEDGTARITDFGISHAFDDVTVTSTGMLTGTPAYLAPEVARGVRSDSASDVYSLGSTLYMAVEGAPPFGSDPNPMAVLHRVASGQPPAPTRSGLLNPMLQAMMSSDPSGRPSMVEIANTLPALHPMAAADAPPPSSADSQTEVIVRDEHPHADPLWDTRAFAAGPPPDPSAPVEDPERHRSWVPIAAALLVVVLGVVLAIVLLDSAGDENGTAAGRSSARPSSSASSSPSRSRSLSQSATTRTTPSSPPSSSRSSRSSASTAGAPTAQDLKDAVVEYFRLVTDDLDAAWARLTAHFQNGRAGGRRSFDSYWKSVDRVDVGSAHGDAPRTATALLTYHYKNGRVVRQQTRFRFVREDGVLKIDGQS